MSDLLLGNHLNRNYDTVKWIDVAMPHKKSRRLKDYKVLQQNAESNPDTAEIFQDNLLDTFYPERPDSLEDVCLHDFVANYDWRSKNSRGRRVYTTLKKHGFQITGSLILENENQRENYYYSLILLFTERRKKYFTG